MCICAEDFGIFRSWIIDKIGKIDPCLDSCERTEKDFDPSDFSINDFEDWQKPMVGSILEVEIENNQVRRYPEVETKVDEVNNY